MERQSIGLAMVAALLCSALCTGCFGCKSCGNGDRPVAPQTYSHESAAEGEPSLPYMLPWWKE